MKRIQSIERAMEVLDTLSSSGEPLSLAYLSEKLDIKKSTLHGIIGTLVSLGYVENHRHLYSIGSGFFGFYPCVESYYNKIKSLFSCHLKNISKSSSAMVLISVPCGIDEYIYIDALSNNEDLNIKDFIGRKENISSTPTGKAIQVFCSQDTRNIFKLGSDSEDEMIKIENQGYATNINDLDISLRHIASPLYQKGKPVAVISLVGTHEQLGNKSIAQHLGLLQGL